MTITTPNLQAIFIGTEEQIVENLRSHLNYPIAQRDNKGSRFWYLRPGNNPEDASETCPIAVGFYSELNEGSNSELKQFFTDEPQQLEIYGHYINRIAENQPVMYLLLPSPQTEGAEAKVALILPTEGRIRQRAIEICKINSEDLRSKFNRLHQEQLQDKILENLLGFTPQIDFIFYKTAQSAQELATELALVTQRIEQVIPLVYEQEKDDGYLHQLLTSFQRELLPNLKLTSDHPKDYSFSDVYAQTIAYGLFTARVFSYVKNPKQDFNRRYAWQELPETNPFLKQLFQDVLEKSTNKLGDDLIDCLDQVLGILRAAKMEAILRDFRNNMNREDIVICFYEDFLGAYKPKMREKRGVYYTPEPVVSYMVRSVDELIKIKFNKPLGIADPEVMILDPACGTGTFLFNIFQLIYQRFQEAPDLFIPPLLRGARGDLNELWNEYVSECLLPRIFGFELLVAPYAICHLKLGLFLEETGYKFASGKRLGVYLINTLENVETKEEKQQLSLAIPQMEELIANEAKAGSRIKKNEPIMVIIGNPPYSGHSENNNSWIKDLLNDYYIINGQPLGEKNSKWLQDDYVKFMRFSQWKIDQNNKGILAFINNHGFLDNPTFRGMRQQLINSFDEIFIYDLHGNSKKKETAFDGGKDENVFDIQQGVSINIMVKN